MLTCCTMDGPRRMRRSQSSQTQPPHPPWLCLHEVTQKSQTWGGSSALARECFPGWVWVCICGVAGGTSLRKCSESSTFVKTLGAGGEAVLFKLEACVCRAGLSSVEAVRSSDSFFSSVRREFQFGFSTARTQPWR